MLTAVPGPCTRPREALRGPCQRLHTAGDRDVTAVNQPLNQQAAATNHRGEWGGRRGL